MKVLHISRADVGGAGGCALKICEAVGKHCDGFDSQMLVFRRRSKSPAVTQYSPVRYRLERLRLELRLFTRLERDLRRVKRASGAVCTLPVSHFDILSHPLVREADIIHLHWVNDFLDYPSFFAGVDKPVVWTLHDTQLFHGVSHLPSDIASATDLSQRMLALKREAVAQCGNLSAVFLSGEMLAAYGSDPALSHAARYEVNNMVDTARFYPRDNAAQVRRELGIEPGEKMIVFVATDIAEPNKGLHRLLSAVERLGGGVRVVAVGSGRASHPQLITAGPIYDHDRLASIYTAADLYVLASECEAFAQTPAEAMACGLPVVMTPVSGSGSLIRGFNGRVSADFSPESLADSIGAALAMRYDSAAIRADVAHRLSPAAIAARYEAIYRRALTTAAEG